MVLAFPTSQQQALTQEPTPTTTIEGAISYDMYRVSDTYKNIFKCADGNLKQIQDKIDCLQRSQVYVHNHLDTVETKLNAKIDDLKRLLLRLSSDDLLKEGLN
jgi:hypothetical protein